MTRYLLILALCATASAQLPPMPPKAYKPANTTKGATALIAPKAVVVPPKTSITMTWNHPDPNVTFNVYHGLTPFVNKMTLLTNVSVRTFTKKMNQQSEFFGVTAVDKNGLESTFGTKQ